MKYKFKKWQIISSSIVIVLIILNPSYSSFKEFTGVIYPQYLNRKANFLIFSIYENKEREPYQQYLGVAMNFINITSPPPPIKQAVRYVPDSTVSETKVSDNQLPPSIKKRALIDTTEDGLPILDKKRKDPLGILQRDSPQIDEEGFPIPKKPKFNPSRPYEKSGVIQMYRANKVGYCKLQNGQKMTGMKWIDCNPNVAIIVDFGKSNIFVNSQEKRLFKIIKIYPAKYTLAFILYKYDTKDLKGNDITIVLTMIKNDKQDYEIAFSYPDMFYVYQMKEVQTKE